MRLAIIQDTAGLWFVRELSASEHDLDDDRMIYYCDNPLAGPFLDLSAVCQWIEDNAKTE